jgi:hypothetical protein
VPVAAADVRQWIWEPFPVILIVYDALKERAFWLYVQWHTETHRITESTAETLTFHIPVLNRLSRSAIERFRVFRDTVLAQVKGVIRHEK